MNVLSLFDGMSCGRIALERLGIPIDNYYASEIDKYAIQVSQANYPDIIQVGDVTELDTSTLPKIDLIMGGSPCQGFSFAGKQLAFDDPRSALFFEFVRCVEELKPKYFLLENVRMKKEYLNVISEYMGVEPIMINSALVSAQNRVRYYWTNIPGIEQPEQRGIVLRDILETQTNEKPVKDTERNQRHYRNDDEKSLCMTATMYKGAGNNGMTLVKETHDTPKHIGTAVDINGHDILKRVYSPDGKSPTVTTCGGGNTEPKVVAGAWRGRYYKDGVRQDQFGSVAGKTKQMLELRKDEKTNTVTTVQKDNVVVTTKPNQINPSKKANGVQPYMQDRVFHVDGKSHCLTKEFASRTNVGETIEVDKEKKQLTIKEATKKGYTTIEDGDCFDMTFPKSKTRRGRNMKDKSNCLTAANYDYMRYEHSDEDKEVYWRKLTPVECERLQTVPDNYTNHVSNTQRYKMLGNGWTIEVITHILKNMEL
jgi:DNA (cytosine-5)-methyltransferase 3A